MKKLLLIILVLTVSCSNSSDDNSSNNSSINPPDWIIGTWLSVIDDVNTGLGYKFTHDDFCQIIGPLTTCYKAQVEGPPGFSVEEEIDNINYIVSLLGGGSSVTFHFRKLSDTEIEAVNSTGLNPIFVKQ